MIYKPSQQILEKYADVLVNFALWSGQGVKKGDVVYLQGSTSALPLYTALRKTLLQAGAHTISGLSDDMSGMARYAYDRASDEQLKFFPRKYYKGLVDQIDHRIAILSDHNMHELDGVDPAKIAMVQKSAKPLIKWLDRKEDQGKHTWTLALYGTPAMAKEAGLSQKDYWDQIIKACFLDYADPKAKWRKVSAQVSRSAEALTKLKIKKLHLIGEDMDLHVAIGENRKWMGGSGRNIPSFEVFTSPDWRGTQGWIRFNQPLYRYGVMVKGIELQFKNGRIVKSKASYNQPFLQSLLATDKGASQLGEFSLTDKRTSRITKFMAETLFDENMGGKYGNTHIAVGRSYFDTHDGDIAKMPISAFRELGFNESVIHTDMISTTDRTVTATLAGGQQKVIYKNGQFTI